MRRLDAPRALIFQHPRRQLLGIAVVDERAVREQPIRAGRSALPDMVQKAQLNQSIRDRDVADASGRLALVDVDVVQAAARRLVDIDAEALGGYRRSGLVFDQRLLADGVDLDVGAGMSAGGLFSSNCSSPLFLLNSTFSCRASRQLGSAHVPPPLQIKVELPSEKAGSFGTLGAEGGSLGDTPGKAKSR